MDLADTGAAVAAFPAGFFPAGFFLVDAGLLTVALVAGLAAAGLTAGLLTVALAADDLAADDLTLLALALAWPSPAGLRLRFVAVAARLADLLGASDLLVAATAGSVAAGAAVDLVVAALPAVFLEIAAALTAVLLAGFLLADLAVGAAVLLALVPARGVWPRARPMAATNCSLVIPLRPAISSCLAKSISLVRDSDVSSEGMVKVGVLRGGADGHRQSGGTASLLGIKINRRGGKCTCLLAQEAFISRSRRPAGAAATAEATACGRSGKATGRSLGSRLTASAKPNGAVEDADSSASDRRQTVHLCGGRWVRESLEEGNRRSGLAILSQISHNFRVGCGPKVRFICRNGVRWLPRQPLAAQPAAPTNS